MILPSHLRRLQDEIREHARSYGLDFFEIIFEVLDWKQINMVAAYGGFPTRYPHWRFGMEYEYLSKSYSYGLSKIYEMVINNDPCYAYLLHANTEMDQKLVMAHVYAHCDFFKNNMWFAHTSRKMMDEMANHGTRMRRYIEKHGMEPVERFLDVCLSIERLIDQHSPYIKRMAGLRREEDEDVRRPVQKLKSKEYMDRYINPDEFVEAQAKKIEQKRERKKKVPSEPVKDAILFLIENAPLKKWERDVLSMIREESYYFAPQAMTKIMNEGWATYWHSRIMTEKVLKDSELIDYADHHSGTLAAGTGRLNPYKVGLELFRDIAERWDKGKFGKDYDECDDMAAKKRWDKKIGQGRRKIFEVRKLYNDVTFIDEFLTEDFCKEHKLFIYDYNPSTGMYEISGRSFKKIKERLLFQLTNYGLPHIYVLDGNHKNRGELLLKHRHEGVDLKLDEAREVLRNVQSIWKRPVHLETIVDGKGRILSFDGSDHKEQQTDQLTLL